jgi:prepilin peptidase CpaA
MLLIAAATDLRGRRIPNALIATIAVVGFLVSTALNPVAPGMLSAFGGLGVGLALWLPGWLFRMMGAADVKLFAAVGAWLGPLGALEVSIFAAVLGGILALGWVIACRGQSGARNTLWLAAVQPRTLLRKRGAEPMRHRLPYSLAIAVAVVVELIFPKLLFR